MKANPEGGHGLHRKHRKLSPRVVGGPSSLDGVPTCQGKKAFSTWSAARKAAGRVRALDGYPMSPYLCRLCHRFHIGGNVLGDRRG